MNDAGPPTEPQPPEYTPEAGRHSIHEFQRQSVLLLLLLAVVTLGIYWLLWIWRQIKVINRLLPENVIAPSWFLLTLLLFSCMYMAIILGLFTRPTREQQLVGEVVDKAGNVLALILTFKIRNRLNIMLRARAGGPYWLSGVATFFLGFLYLQYKINRFQQRIPRYGYCAQCGYDLRGLTQPRCPECGTTFDPHERGVCLATLVDSDTR